MGAIVLDISKVNSYVLPNLVKSKNTIQDAYSASTSLRNNLPNSFKYVNLVSDIINQIYKSKTEINNVNNIISNKINNAKNIESNSEKNASKISSMLSKIGAVSGVAIGNATGGVIGATVGGGVGKKVGKTIVDTGAKVVSKVVSSVNQIKTNIVNDFKQLGSEIKKTYNSAINYVSEKTKKVNEWMSKSTGAYVSNSKIDFLKIFKSIIDSKAYQKIAGTVGSFIYSIVEGFLSLGEGSFDGSVYGIAKTLQFFGVDDKWAENIISYDVSGNLYDLYVDTMGIDEDIAYGKTHAIGNQIGDFLGYYALSAIPFAGPALSIVGGAGKEVEGSINNQLEKTGTVNDYKVFFSSALGALEGLGMLKAVKAAQAGIKAISELGGKQVLKQTLGSFSKEGINTVLKTPKLKLASKAIKNTFKLTWKATKNTFKDADTWIDTCSVLGNNIYSGIDTGEWDLSKMALETGTVVFGNFIGNFLGGFGESALDNSAAKLDLNKVELDDLKYKKTNSVVYATDYMKSNFNKFKYTDTNLIDGLNSEIKQNGLYHFVKKWDASDSILESKEIWSSGVIDSYGNKKTFFFSGVPDAGAYASNIGKLPLKTQAIKVDPSDAMLNSSKLRVRNFDDGAITWDGDVKLDGLNATKEYFVLAKENDRLVYKNVSEEVFNNYEFTSEGKALSDFVNKKSNINAIKQDYYAELSMKSTNAKISKTSKTVIPKNISVDDLEIELSNLNNKIEVNKKEWHELYQKTKTSEYKEAIENIENGYAGNLKNMDDAISINNRMKTLETEMDILTRDKQSLEKSLEVLKINSLDDQISLANHHTGKGRTYEIKVEDLNQIPSDFYNNLTNPENVKFNINNKIVDSIQVEVVKSLGFSDIDNITAIKKNPVDFYLNNTTNLQKLGLNFDDFVKVFDINLNKYGIDEALGAAVAYNDKNIFLIQKIKQLETDGILDPNDINLLSSLIGQSSANIDSDALQTALSKYLSPDEIDVLNTIKNSGKMNLTSNEAAAIYQYQAVGGNNIAMFNRGNNSFNNGWSLKEIEQKMNDAQIKSGTGVLRDLNSGRTIVEEIDSAISKNLNKQTLTAVRYCNSVGPEIDLEDFLNGTKSPEYLVGKEFTDKANTSFTILHDKKTNYSNKDIKTGTFRNKIKIEAVLAPETGAFIESQGGLKNYSLMEFLSKRNTKNKIVNAYWDVDGRLIIQTLVTTK